MSYHLYQTEGIVLGSANIGESNRYYHLLTKDLGLVTAFAQGVRELKSKLRFHMEPFAHLNTELVRGKEKWRLVSVSPKNPIPTLTSEQVAIFSNIAATIRRLVHGEEKNEKLFLEMENLIKFLREENLSSDEKNNLELTIVARILHSLGYFAPSKDEIDFFERPLGREDIVFFKENRKELLSRVNRALDETHL